MPQGMRVWDASGNLVLDVSDRIMTVLGVIEVTANTPNGQVTVNDSRLALGERWYFKTGNGTSFGGFTSATVTSDSSSISVSVANHQAIGGVLRVVYGVY